MKDAITLLALTQWQLGVSGIT
ncbi:hypothetical protein BOSE127_80024 [Bosea sp. 127]|nr:hypothetical protein BOSE127_80024 [Bosea sp. 127]